LVKKVDVFLADLAHTNSVSNESLTIPLNIAYVKSYAARHFGNAVDITLFKHPEKFLAQLVELKPNVVGFANYGWNENLNLMMGNYIRQKFPETLLENVAAFSFAEFSPLNIQDKTTSVDLTPESVSFLKLPPTVRKINFVENKNRSELREIITDSSKMTLSKVLNTQGITLKDLRMHTSI